MKEMSITEAPGQGAGVWLLLPVLLLVLACGGSVKTAGDGETDVDGRCLSSELLTASQISLDPSLYDGQTFIVDAPVFSEVNCTDMACPPADPCCNDCSGKYAFDVGDMRCTVEGPAGETWECSGDECNVACGPFGRFTRSEPLAGKQFLGTFTILTSLRCEFQVVAVCR